MALCLKNLAAIRALISIRHMGFDVQHGMESISDLSPSKLELAVGLSGVDPKSLFEKATEGIPSVLLEDGIRETNPSGFVQPENYDRFMHEKYLPAKCCRLDSAENFGLASFRVRNDLLMMKIMIYEAFVHEQ
ncbi:hypothetical protein CISG_07724 [Coccidioides immitis RMSCC 3703]|uniref:Uncharacterized protein n=2 Tax=Coccidioides immitis TaxID=5501 RepID=A0A0J8R6D7_COCIT|nr:hypothetical protein CIRG_06508 [Coccidioides immitis RMSCC 2394]KMU79293.1 hypothetical protein CISG_07724 [Coccidioides immitis RMSCC 3703]